MDSPTERLQHAARDVWVDPTDTARRVGEALGDLLAEGWDGDGIRMVEELRRRRADHPLVLAVTEPALEANPVRAKRGIDAILARLDDWTWTLGLGTHIAKFQTVGVLSLGLPTLAVLEAAVAEGRDLEELHTDSRAVAKGLEFLFVSVIHAAPEEADALVVPGVARFGSRLWTSARAADAALRARLRHRAVVPITHPLAVLTPRNRAAYRPASYLVDTEI